MLFVKLKNEKETIIFSNGYFRDTQRNYETEQYLKKVSGSSSKEVILPENMKTIECQLTLTMKLPTTVTAESAFAKEIKKVNKGDKVIIRSDATYKVKKAFWNRVRDFLNM